MPSGEKMHEYWEGYRAGRLHALFVGVHQAQNYHFQIDDVGSESDKTYKAGYNRGINSIIEQYLSENAKRFKN